MKHQFTIMALVALVSLAGCDVFEPQGGVDVEGVATGDRGGSWNLEFGDVDGRAEILLSVENDDVYVLDLAIDYDPILGEPEADVSWFVPRETDTVEKLGELHGDDLELELLGEVLASRNAGASCFDANVRIRIDGTLHDGSGEGMVEFYFFKRSDAKALPLRVETTYTARRSF